MEKISKALEGGVELSVRGIRSAVPGDDSSKTLATELLVSEGYVSVEPRGSARVHRSVRPFRAADAAGEGR